MKKITSVVMNLSNYVSLQVLRYMCYMHSIYMYLAITAESIKTFMTYYRQQFPTSSVTPKMHMLEEHLVPWLRRWKVGFGLLGEQGAESIHAYFNSLKRTYCGIPDKLKRLKQIMTEHHLHIAPDNIAVRPEIKRRKITDVEE